MALKNMNKFYVINDRPEIDFRVNNSAIIYRNKEAAFRTLAGMNNFGDLKLKVYEIRIIGNLLTDGWNIKEVFYENKK